MIATRYLAYLGAMRTISHHRSKFLAALVLAVGVIIATVSQSGAQQAGSSTYIAPTANTSIPVYDTAWQMLVLATPDEADEYFEELKDRGFTGCLLYTSPSPRDATLSRMPSSA